MDKTSKVGESNAPPPNDTNGWEVGPPLGKGGNGQVWEVQKNGTAGALKRLFTHKKFPERHLRFRDEVGAMRKCSGIAGVLPIYDEDLDCSRPWFVMARATPIREALGNESSLYNVVVAMHGIANVLAQLHSCGVTHRDIKPENLFIYNSVWSVGDFGLATFDGKESKTQSGEKIGPIHYIAPEMLNDAKESRGEPADVFSLAKTLWVLATGQSFALPGSYYSKYDVFRLGQYISSERTRHIDMLIEACTAVIPESRPSMQHVLNELSAWLNPSVAEMTSVMKIDIGDYANKLDNVQAETEAKNAREQDAYNNRVIVKQRMDLLFKPFLTELGASLKLLKFKNVSVSYDPEAKATASIATPDETSPSFSVSLSSNVSGSIIKINATVSFTRGPSYFSRLRIWGKEIDFIDGSSAEEPKVAMLLEFMRSQMSVWVNSALAIAFGPSEQLIDHSSFKKRIKVLDQHGNPIQDAAVAIIRSDGLHQFETTNDRGVVSPSHGPANPYMVFAAHAEYKSNTSTVIGDITEITLERADNFCSCLANTGWFSIPNIGHGIDFIIDKNKMYIYSSKDVLIDNGASQPVGIEVGRTIQLRNALGHVTNVTLSAVCGTCILFDIETLI
ncbi:Serine/threonine protein kinase [Pseudomonas sp. NFACC15-1]|uniref:protein kinase domain-containing protein n=1 Tax=unclassified Pseudomonas TaxID=196821 RepID=UPI00088A6120|nr:MULTISPECIES: protein kinase [unclassified Pseudomonas]SDA63462.1 Serine/threonine protein kinase [Pseudomonas sp. NFACC15-1]SDX91950.1 Serine/threonine protein kinase [Pseudomonas sp. NFACC14]